MNGLSWLLYFADVSEALRLFSNVVWIILLIVLIVSLILWMAVEDDSSQQNKDDFRKFIGRLWWFSLPTFLIFMTFFIVIPQRQTFMLIAASEFGEEVLNNTDVQAIGGEAGDLAVDSLSLLRKYINDQLEEEKTDE